MTRCTLDLLHSALDRDDAKLDCDPSKSKITRDTRIFFVCKCGEKHDKLFRYIIENGGAFCKLCLNDKV